ncbi:MAG: coat domain protein [Firmicutes bacterium]|nr:coat domain protein [Bacillota bacterium]
MTQQQQQSQKSPQDMELVGTLIYQLKMESTTLCTAVMESASDSVRSQLTPILNQSLRDQKLVFDLMNQKGWYKVEPAPQEQYQRVQQSFISMQQQQSQGQQQYQ